MWCGRRVRARGLTVAIFIESLFERSVVGLAEVVFGLLAFCPHYTRLSSFVFSRYTDEKHLVAAGWPDGANM